MKKLLLAASILLSGSIIAQEDTAVKKVQYPAGYDAKIDVVYTKVKDWEGRADIYYNPKMGKPTPVVFNIHGGGWNHGTKESQTGFSTFFKMGLAVVNVEYRLTPQATAPAAIEDVRCAMLYVVQHAKELNIDPNNIIMMGGSAGGHLALMAGLLQNDHKFDNNCKGVDGFKIVAIVDKYGIADVWDWGYGKDITSKSAGNWLGDKAKDETFARSVSPIYYVTKNSPPTIIIHGDADPTVPYQQSVKLHQKFVDAGVKTEFITVPGGKHGGFPKEENSKVNKAIADFLASLNLR
ncbi:alpha/beta hydrolase fold domain-containing protein [Chitinophagaceae bacterium LWZ2-11]